MRTTPSDTPTTRDLSFGRYETIAKIGEGASGQVFLARSRGEAGFERLFAVKVMHRDNPEVSSALVRESQLACRIQHRNVVSVVDVGANRDGPYLVMEYVEGCTLSELNGRSREQRPPRLVLPILIEALFGLHAIHTCKDEQGVNLELVHRDVSPQNLLVGVDGACRMSDFGIAAPHNRVLKTRSDRVRGTPGYMSPEQVVGGDIDLRSDLFSAGVVLWNTLTGKKLFDAPTEHASLFHVLKRKIPRPSQVGLRPPAVFDALILRALERDPARRFQSAEEMAVALRDAAISAGALGGPSEVAAWVTAMFGAELEARRRAIREATAQRAVPRADDKRPSLVAMSTALPRLRSNTQSASDPSERLSLDDLSLESDEIAVVQNLLGPSGARSARSAVVGRTGAGGQPGWKRWAPAAAAALLVIGVGGWLLTRGGSEEEKAPAAAATAPGAATAPAATAAPVTGDVAAAPPTSPGATGATIPPAAADSTVAAPPAETIEPDESDSVADNGGDDASPSRPPRTGTPPRKGDRRLPKRATAAPSEPAAARPAEQPAPARPSGSDEVEGNPYIYKK